MIVGSRRAADAMNTHARKSEIDARARGFGHEPAAGRVAPEPIAELAGAMQVHARIETDDAQKLAALTIADRETHRASGVPIGGASFGVALTRFRRIAERHPRQPAFEMPARTVHGVPELRSVGRLDRNEQRARRFDRGSADRGA